MTDSWRIDRREFWSGMQVTTSLALWNAWLTGAARTGLYQPAQAKHIRNYLMDPYLCDRSLAIICSAVVLLVCSANATTWESTYGRPDFGNWVPDYLAALTLTALL